MRKHIQLTAWVQGEDEVAFRVTGMEGIERGCGHVYTATNDIELRSLSFPNWGGCLHLWGACEYYDDSVVTCSFARWLRIKAAVKEFNDKYDGEKPVQVDGFEVVG